MQVIPRRNRVYSVFWHFSTLPDQQEYNLAVQASSVERAISKVKRELLDEYAVTRREIVVDAVELKS